MTDPARNSTAGGGWLHGALRSDALWLRAARFCLVGVASGLIFAAFTICSIAVFGVGHKLASVYGYLASLPLNFLANRRFSFRSGNALADDAMRFLSLQVGNLCITAFAMGAVVDFLRLHYMFGIIAAIALVPVVNFVIMQWWVFRRRDPR
jgi:putative flippase GtrA